MTTLVCIAEEAEALGHHASLVLGQIRFWLYKANNGQNRFVVTRCGQRWLAHSREQLCEETRLSPRQIRDALAKLKKQDFIRVEQHLFHGKNVSHFQAAKEGRLAEKAPIKVDQGGSPAVDESAHPELDSKDQLIREENDLEIEEECGAPNAPITSGKNLRKKKIQEEGKQRESKVENDLPRSPETAGTASDLSSVFRRAWTETYPDSFLPEFNSKRMGQFKNLLQRCPEGDASPIVDYSVRHWHVFCSYAHNMEGAFNLPQLPEVGTLLKFVQSAANLYLQERQCKSKEKPAQKPRVTAPQSPPMPQEPPDQPASLEEVAAAFGFEV